jgi:hypothetical protein
MSLTQGIMLLLCLLGAAALGLQITDAWKRSTLRGLLMLVTTILMVAGFVVLLAIIWPLLAIL